MIQDNPHLKIVRKSIRRFRDGEIDILGLQQNFSAIMSALEGVPKEVSDAIRKAEAWIDSIRFTVNKSEQAVEVEKVLHELEAIIGRYDA